MTKWHIQDLRWESPISNHKTTTTKATLEILSFQLKLICFIKKNPITYLFNGNLILKSWVHNLKNDSYYFYSNRLLWTGKNICPEWLWWLLFQDWTLDFPNGVLNMSLYLCTLWQRLHPHHLSYFLAWFWNWSER